MGWVNNHIFIHPVLSIQTPNCYVSNAQHYNCSNSTENAEITVETNLLLEYNPAYQSHQKKIHATYYRKQDMPLNMCSCVDYGKRDSNNTGA